LLFRLGTTTPAPNKRQWPELVGMNGDEAVKIIKQETGNNGNDSSLNLLSVPFH
jgi:hypothetical protein